MLALIGELASLVLEALAGVDWSKLAGSQWAAVINAAISMLRTAVGFFAPAAALVK